MPLPDFVVCTNNICTEMIKWFENIAKKCGIPMIVYDIPYNTEYEVSRSRLDYMKAQIPELIKSLEQIAGKKWDWEHNQVCRTGGKTRLHRSHPPDATGGRKVGTVENQLYQGKN